MKIQKLAKIIAGTVIAGGLLYDFTKTSSDNFTDIYQGHKAPNYEGQNIRLVFDKESLEFRGTRNPDHVVTATHLDYDSAGKKLEIGKQYKVTFDKHTGITGKAYFGDELVADTITPIVNVNTKKLNNLLTYNKHK